MKIPMVDDESSAAGAHCRVNKPLKVLIVEDHEENRNLLRLLLEVNGYRVTVAGDGLEALAAARRGHPAHNKFGAA